ncbi:MAG: hypothetical protein ACMUHY_06830 [Thermoplasmatota archaeon]
MIAIGIVVLLAGCGVAVYRSGLEASGSGRDRELEDMVSEITSDFGSGSGALSMTKLGTGYGMIGIKDGKSAMIFVETMDGDSLTLYIPDKETYEARYGDGSVHTSTKVPISTDDGMVVPGKLEVTLVG